MAAMAMFGPTQFAARLGPALLAWGLGAALFGHCRRWHGLAAARLALLVLATSPLFFIGGQLAGFGLQHGHGACDLPGGGGDGQ